MYTRPQTHVNHAALCNGTVKTCTLYSSRQFSAYSTVQPLYSFLLLALSGIGIYAKLVCDVSELQMGRFIRVCFYFWTFSTVVAPLPSSGKLLPMYVL